MQVIVSISPPEEAEFGVDLIMLAVGDGRTVGEDLAVGIFVGKVEGVGVALHSHVKSFGQSGFRQKP